MESGIYFIYLVDVDRKLATLGILTIYDSFSPQGQELRLASRLDPKKINEGLWNADCAGLKVSCWKTLYAWLGRGSGWAIFDAASAQRLIPHWVGPEVRYDCERIDHRNFEFVDKNLGMPKDDVPSVELSGKSPEGIGLLFESRIADNLLLTRRRIFDVP